MRTYILAGLMLSLIAPAYAQTTAPIPGMSSVAPMTPAQSLRSRLQSAVPSNQPSSTTGQTPGPATSAPMTTSPTVTAPAALGMAASAATGRHRRTQQERFDEANTTRDGHLTLAQAQASPPHGWNMIIKNFTTIDAANKGYVTMEDIHAYRSARGKVSRAARTH